MINRKDLETPYTDLELQHMRADGVRRKVVNPGPRPGGGGIQITESSLGGAMERVVHGKPSDTVHFVKGKL